MIERAGSRSVRVRVRRHREKSSQLLGEFLQLGESRPTLLVSTLVQCQAFAKYIHTDTSSTTTT